MQKSDERVCEGKGVRGCGSKQPGLRPVAAPQGVARGTPQGVRGTYPFFLLQDGEQTFGPLAALAGALAGGWAPI